MTVTTPEIDNDKTPIYSAGYRREVRQKSWVLDVLSDSKDYALSPATEILARQQKRSTIRKRRENEIEEEARRRRKLVVNQRLEEATQKSDAAEVVADSYDVPPPPPQQPVGVPEGLSLEHRVKYLKVTSSSPVLERHNSMPINRTSNTTGTTRGGSRPGTITRCVSMNELPPRQRSDVPRPKRPSYSPDVPPGKQQE